MEYTCKRGHRVTTRGNDLAPVAYSVDVFGPGGNTTHNYRFCPHCLGEWGMAKFGLAAVGAGGSASSGRGSPLEMADEGDKRDTDF
jgi:hypothetical protein